MGYKLQKIYNFTCDDCRGSQNFIDVGAARASGWAISKDRSKCYCRNCGENRRNVGRNGGKKIATISSGGYNFIKAKIKEPLKIRQFDLCGYMTTTSKTIWRCFSVCGQYNGVFTTDSEKEKETFISAVIKKGEDVLIVEYEQRQSLVFKAQK